MGKIETPTPLFPEIKIDQNSEMMRFETIIRIHQDGIYYLSKVMECIKFYAYLDDVGKELLIHECFKRFTFQCYVHMHLSNVNTSIVTSGADGKAPVAVFVIDKDQRSEKERLNDLMLTLCSK